MKRIALLTILCISFSTFLLAQNDVQAVNVLNKASAAYSKAGGVKASFSLKVLDFGGKVKDELKGSIKLKGSKFKLEVEEMTTWFDGKNQWVYLVKNSEVNLSNPTEEELLMVNPINVFQLYKHGYACKWLGEKKQGGKTLLNVEMKPDNKNETLKNIVASFDKTNYRPVSITITNKDKSGSIISIPVYTAGQSYPDGLFVFQQKDFPNTEVIDLR
jgi:outer membrane lipoprotein-sorting protein